MNKLSPGWFSELSSLWPGQCMSLAVEKVLYSGKSKFQKIDVFKSKSHGVVLCLDDVIQVTENDEFSYQEMITHIPINCHPNPEKVLVIGGGDGGAVRELDKHPNVKEIVLCEIDEEVIEISKKFVPFLASGFQSEKLTINIGDGFEFMKNHKNSFDVIITDSSDPIGPAASLFQKSYYELLKQALRPGGIVCSQGECMWLHLDIIKELMNDCKGLFPVVDYAYTSIPTYPSGSIGFILCSLNPDTSFKKPIFKVDDNLADELQLRYYSDKIHEASFALPRFVMKALKS